MSRLFSGDENDSEGNDRSKKQQEQKQQQKRQKLIFSIQCFFAVDADANELFKILKTFCLFFVLFFIRFLANKKDNLQVVLLLKFAVFFKKLIF